MPDKSPASTGPAKLAAILHARMDAPETTATERAYAQHYQDCQQCGATTDVVQMCSLGRHLYCKLLIGGEDDE